MTKPGRIPCINPRCKRTAPEDKYGPGTEIICGKCFRKLPEALRREHRRCWREIRKWEKRITKTSDELKRHQMGTILQLWENRLDGNWKEIRDWIVAPPKPQGLDNFLDEMGMKE